MNANLYDEGNGFLGQEFVALDENGVAEYPAPRDGAVWCAMGENAQGVPCFCLMEL